MQHWDKDIRTLTFLTCDMGVPTTTHVALLNFSVRYMFKKGGDLLMCSLERLYTKQRLNLARAPAPPSKSTTALQRIHRSFMGQWACRAK